jgi:hypothetical protein
MRLEESGHRKQTELVEELGMKDYAMSRRSRGWNFTGTLLVDAREPTNSSALYEP